MKNLLIIVVLILICGFHSSGQINFVPDEVQVRTLEPVYWNKEKQTTSFLHLFPAGSKVVGCADMPLYAAQSNSSTQEYLGTIFLVQLPAHIATSIVADSSRYFAQSQGLIKNLWLNLIGAVHSSLPLSHSDPDFATGQYHMKYDLVAISSGVRYTGWQHASGYVFNNTARMPIAVLDCGANFSHQDMVNSYWINTAEIPANGIDDDGNGYIDDINGYDMVNSDNNPTDDNPGSHGSATAGVLGARHNNSKNICGVITDTMSLMILKVANAAGAVTDFNTSAGYYYALSKHVRIVNMSFGFVSTPSSLMTAIALGVTSTYNCVPVASVGNGGVYEWIYPGAGPNIYTIGNASSSGVRDASSSYNDSIDNMARGVNVKTISGTSSTATVVVSGSSFSGPFGAGYVWRLLKTDSNLTVGQVIVIMRSYGINHGVFAPMTGYGYLVGMDTMSYTYMKPDTLVSFPACSGKHALPYTHHFKIVDSLRYGLTSIIGDSINTNGMTPGTYTYYMAWKSEPRPGEYYRDTFALKVIITTGTVVTPTISISATPAGSICAGTSVSYTATHTNGGTSPAFQWKVNGVSVGSSIPTHSYAPANGDVVTCTLTSSLACVTTPTVVATMTMTVNPVVVPAVTIVAAPGSTICTGSPVTFTPTPVGGGTPTYQWYKNGVVVSTSPTYASSTLVSGDNVWCVMSSTAPCAMPTSVTSNTVTMTVGAPVTPTISVSASPSGTVCAGASVTYTAAITNGGSSPTYQWKVNGVTVGGSTAAHSYAPANGDVITCKLTSSLTCVTTTTVTSTPITATVNPLTPNSVTIAVTPSATICAGTAVTFTPTPIGGGSTPSYQWRVNGTIMGTGTTYSSSSLASSDNVWVTMMSSAPCPTPASVTSNTVTMTVNPIIVPSVTITPTPGSTICAGTPVTFTLASSGGGTPSYSWKLNGTTVGTGTTYASSSLVTGDLVWVAMTSTATCATPATVTSNTVTMTVSAPTTPSSSASATSTTICSLNGDTLTASCSVVGATLQWQGFSGSWSNVSGATTSPHYTGLLPVGSNQFRGVYTMPAGCFTRAYDTTPVVTINVNAATPAPALISVTGVAIFVATGVYQGVYTATIPSGVTTYTIDWYLHGVYQATTTTNSWVHNPMVNGHPDTVRVVFKPDGCYSPDSTISGAIYLKSPVSVAALTKGSMNIYPNPVHTVMSVEGAQNGDQAIIINILGQVVMKQTFTGQSVEGIDMTNLIPGIYTLRIMNDNNTSVLVYKILKE